MSWNPVKDSRGGYHCTKCSGGCLNCWAEKINLRAGGKPYDNSPVEFVLDEKTLGKITHPKPKIFFVCDLCDIFHEKVPQDFRTRVFDKMCSWRWPSKAAEREGDYTNLEDPGHKYLVLTKRPENILPWLDWIGEYWPGDTPFNACLEAYGKIPGNIWPGVSVCDASEKSKIDILREIPAAHRWVNFGPLLGPMDQVLLTGIEWVVFEAESLGGRPGRECNWTWMLSLVHQAKDQGVPCWVKQINYRNRLVKKLEELPAELRVREYPRGLAPGTAGVPWPDGIDERMMSDELRATNNEGCSDL